MKNTKKGFTLVELLVVIAILAILASVAVVGYSAFIGKADDQAAKTEIAQIEALLDVALVTDGTVEITKTEGSAYILITKTTSGSTVTITVESKTAATSGATNITAELGETLAKVSYSDSKLIYTYKTGSTPVTLLP